MNRGLQEDAGGQRIDSHQPFVIDHVAKPASGTGIP